MAHWEAYFDESGNDNMSTVFCLGGYVMASAAARQLEARWRDALREAGASTFHMVDVAPGNGEYRRISKKARIALQTKCIQLIKKFASRGQCYFFNPQRYRTPSGKAIYNDVYMQAVAYCILSTCQFLRSVDHDPKLHIFFEAGHASEGLAQAKIGSAYLQLDKLLPSGSPSITYAGKKDVTLLQCGDLLAWQAAKYVKDLVEQKRPPRNDFRALMQMHHTFVYFHSENEERTLAPQRFIPGMNWEEIYDERFRRYLRALFSSGIEADTAIRETYDLYDTNHPENRLEPQKDPMFLKKFLMKGVF